VQAALRVSAITVPDELVQAGDEPDGYVTLRQDPLGPIGLAQEKNRLH
jgi:hypothetical protein